ncbi:MAG: hypothetical protein NTW59_02465 [Candidatus Diapherotrites archaeon]|nr:hypothetical protein [Candidatus Diapherotrites archaeon]
MKQKPILLGLMLLLVSFSLAGARADSICNDIAVDVEDGTFTGNASGYLYFPINNYSNYSFEVYEIQAYKEDSSSPFTVTATDYSSRIAADSSGEITLRVNAEGVNTDTNGRAIVRVRGIFGDGTYCGFGDIGDSKFNIKVQTQQSAGNDCRSIRMHASGIYIDEASAGTYSFTIENTANRQFDLYGIEVSEDSGYFDATLYNKPSAVSAGNAATFRVRINSNSVSAERSGTVTLKARGKFRDSAYCYYDDMVEEQFTVHVRNSGTGGGGGTTPSEAEAGCLDIGINSSTLAVAQGETANATFYIVNSGIENFYIDYVDAFDNSGNFTTETAGYDKLAKAGKTAAFTVKARAYDGAELGSEYAFIDVKGHFQNQESCYIDANGVEAFRVSIVNKAPASGSFAPAPTPSTVACSSSGTSLSAPESQDVGANSNVPITINNTSGSRITIRLQGPGLTVNPSLISVPKYTKIIRAALQCREPTGAQRPMQ